jgi:predicted metal-dependent phosphoesterase TrpH
MGQTKQKQVDLHTHTKESDGLLSPKTLIEEASAAGLTALAITDHDTVSGYRKAKDHAAKCQIELIPGIELSASIGSEEIHILGYFIEPEHLLLKAYLEKHVQAREARACAIIENLNHFGHEIEIDNILAYAGNGVIARPHIAEAMVDRGIVKNYLEAFDLWIGNGKPACVDKRNDTPTSVIDLIHHCAGVAVLAHPGSKFPSTILDSLVAAGLDGIEVFHPRHHYHTQQHYKQYALKNNLIITGGSDFHGGRKVNESIGSCFVSYQTVEQLYNRHLETRRKNLQNY